MTPPPTHHQRRRLRCRRLLEKREGRVQISRREKYQAWIPIFLLRLLEKKKKILPKELTNKTRSKKLLLRPLNKKKSTAITCEDTILLRIDKTKAQELFVRGSGNVAARIQFLKEITLFKRVDELILMTLANSLKIQTYSYGEFIV